MESELSSKISKKQKDIKKKPAKPNTRINPAPRNKRTTNKLKKRLIEIKDSRSIETDWNYRHAFLSGHLNDQDPPEEYNNRDDSWWSIEDQGKSSACVGWATADVVRWYLADKNYIDKDTDAKLSARFIWMAAKEIDSLTVEPTSFIEKAGSTLKAGLDVCRKYGSVPDEMLPSKKQKLYEGTSKQFYAIAAKYKITSYYNLIVVKGSLTEEERRKYQLTVWKKWIAENGPVLVRVIVDDNWLDPANTALNKHNADRIANNHAVSIIGYTNDHFIIRNSWGTDWGDEGYRNVSADYALDAFNEAYGIVILNESVNAPENDKLPCPHLFPC